MVQPKDSLAQETDNKKTQINNKKSLSKKQVNALIIDSEIAINETLAELETVRAVAAKAGLSIECTTLPFSSTAQSMGLITNPSTAVDAPLQEGGRTAGSVANRLISLTVEGADSFNFTGGHSNTDHTIVRTGDEKQDRLAEMRRNYLRRYRAMKPENRGEDRWDKPRLPGERRRRIQRDRDLEEAPPEPPKTGYIAFVGQMTTKIRHDRPDEQHDQTKVVQEISKLWRTGMSEDDREYYNQFATDATEAYQRQMVEYRATGGFTPCEEFVKLPEVNVWVRRKEKQNGLEKEIGSYANLVFPKRPARLDEAYEEREVRSKFKRKLKLKGLINEDGTLKDGLDFEEMLDEERKAKKQKQS